MTDSSVTMSLIQIYQEKRLLGGIVMGNPYNCEDEVTNRIVELLQGKKYIRNLILRWLFPDIKNEILDSIEAWHIITRTGEEDGSRPDIRISNAECYLLIENKIYKTTQLTYSEESDSQAKRYTDLVRHADSKVKKGVFLIPEGYNHEDELLEEIKSHRASEFMAIKHWNNFLNYIEDLEIEPLEMDIYYLRNAVDNAERSEEEENEKKEILSSPENFDSILDLTREIMYLFKYFLDSRDCEYEMVSFDDDEYSKDSFRFIGYRFNFQKNGNPYESAILFNYHGNFPDSTYTLSFSFNKNDYKETDELEPAKCGMGKSKIYFPIFDNETDLYPFLDEEDIVEEAESFRKMANRIFNKICRQLI